MQKWVWKIKTLNTEMSSKYAYKWKKKQKQNPNSIDWINFRNR